MSDGDLRKLAEKFEKELEPKRTDLIESQKKMIQEIWDDIVKATEVTQSPLFEVKFVNTGLPGKMLSVPR